MTIFSANWPSITWARNDLGHGINADDLRHDALDHAGGKQHRKKTVLATTDPADSSPAVPEAIREARVKGYEGDPCPICQRFTLVRNGACMKCVSCGMTTGCS